MDFTTRTFPFVQGFDPGYGATSLSDADTAWGVIAGLREGAPDGEIVITLGGDGGETLSITVEGQYLYDWLSLYCAD